MIRMSKRLISQIINQAKLELPNEACGLLAGSIVDGGIEVIEAFPLTNLDESPEHFSMDPKEQFNAVRAMRAKGLKLLGNYHSHPATPARPSQEDIRLAYDPKGIYMIMSLQEQTPVLKAFNIEKGKYTQIPLEILD